MAISRYIVVCEGGHPTPCCAVSHWLARRGFSRDREHDVVLWSPARRCPPGPILRRLSRGISRAFPRMSSGKSCARTWSDSTTSTSQP